MRGKTAILRCGASSLLLDDPRHELADEFLDLTLRDGLGPPALLLGAILGLGWKRALGGHDHRDWLLRHWRVAILNQVKLMARKCRRLLLRT